MTNLQQMSRADRFEAGFPIRLTDVDTYCKYIRAIKPEKNSMTIQELFEGMSALP